MFLSFALDLNVISHRRKQMAVTKKKSATAKKPAKTVKKASSSKSASKLLATVRKNEKLARGKWRDAIKKAAATQKDAQVKFKAFKAEVKQKLEQASAAAYEKGRDEAQKEIEKIQAAREKAIATAISKFETTIGKSTLKKRKVTKGAKAKTVKKAVKKPVKKAVKKIVSKKSSDSSKRAAAK